MEIEGEDGTKLSLKPGVKAVFGRGAGFNTDDVTVSRRHVSLELNPAAAGTERSDRVSFEVLGRNPVWVRTGQPGAKIQTFRKPETGEIAAGERFCVSGHLPVWLTLKRRDEATEERASDGENGIDISDIDPAKEFVFLVIGKEFDQYPNSWILDIKQWEWYLEDSTNGNSNDDDDDEDGDKKGRKGLSKKRRRKKGNENDDWSVDSEEDKELMVKSKSVRSPTYSTRSKKSKKDPNASSSGSSSCAQTKQRGSVDVEEDEDDETLGGFIVSDEETKLEEEDEPTIDDDEEDEEEEDEEEEDFDEDEDDE